MKICVTGASGFVGKSFCSVLRRSGFDVIQIKWHDVVFDINATDIRKKSDWRLSLKSCDVVVHLAALTCDDNEKSYEQFRQINVEGTRKLVMEAACNGSKRVIFLSTIKVFGESNTYAFHEDDKFDPQTFYAQSKLEAELVIKEIALQNGIEFVIIRAPLIYGPGCKGNFDAIVRWIRSGIPLPFGAIYNSRSFVAIDNLVDFLLLCVERSRSPKASNEIFHISDGDDISTKELCDRIAISFGLTSRLVTVPNVLLKQGLILFGKRNVAHRICTDLRVDSNKVRRALGWTPIISMNEQLKKIAEYDKNI